MEQFLSLATLKFKTGPQGSKQASAQPRMAVEAFISLCDFSNLERLSVSAVALVT
jgi:hypothetical protein